MFPPNRAPTGRLCFLLNAKPAGYTVARDAFWLENQLVPEHHFPVLLVHKLHVAVL